MVTPKLEEARRRWGTAGVIRGAAVEPPPSPPARPPQGTSGPLSPDAA
jgi:hypothetical protein